MDQDFTLYRIRIAKLEQHCGNLSQENTVLRTEKDAVTECLQRVLLFLGEMVSKVKQQLAADDNDDVGIPCDQDVAGGGGAYSPTLKEFVMAPDDRKVEAALLATTDTEETIRHMFPFLLRCVHNSVHGTSSGRSSRGRSPIANEGDVADERRGAQRSDLEGSPGSVSNASTTGGSLSDDIVRRVFEAIEYDRRLKLVARMHNDILRRSWQCIAESHQHHAEVAAGERPPPDVTVAGEDIEPVDFNPISIAREGHDIAPALPPQQREEAEQSTRSYTIPPPLLVIEHPRDTQQLINNREELESVGEIQENTIFSDRLSLSSDVARQFLREAKALVGMPTDDSSTGGRKRGVSHGFMPSKHNSVDVDPPLATPTHSTDVSCNDEPNSGCEGDTVTHRQAAGTRPSAAAAASAVPNGSEVSSVSSSSSGDSVEHRDGEGGARGVSSRQRRVFFGMDVVSYLSTIDHSGAETPVLRIVLVRAGTASAKAGIREGDILMTINESPIRSHEDLASVADILNGQPSGTAVQVEVLRPSSSLQHSSDIQGRTKSFFFVPDELPLEGSLEGDPSLATSADTFDRTCVSKSSSTAGAPTRSMRFGLERKQPDVWAELSGERSPRTLGGGTTTERGHSSGDRVVAAVSDGVLGQLWSTPNRSPTRRRDLIGTFTTPPPLSPSRTTRNAVGAITASPMEQKLSATLDRLKEMQRKREEVLSQQSSLSAMRGNLSRSSDCSTEGDRSLDVGQSISHSNNKKSALPIQTLRRGIISPPGRRIRSISPTATRTSTYAGSIESSSGYSSPFRYGTLGRPTAPVVLHGGLISSDIPTRKRSPVGKPWL